MATHSSILAWRIPGTGEPGGLPSMGSHRVGHDWSDLAAAAGCFINSINSSIIILYKDRENWFLYKIIKAKHKFCKIKRKWNKTKNYYTTILKTNF